MLQHRIAAVRGKTVAVVPHRLLPSAATAADAFNNFHLSLPVNVGDAARAGVAAEARESN